MSTSAILTGLENLSLKEKALTKARDLQKKYTKAEKNLQVQNSICPSIPILLNCGMPFGNQECKRQLAMAEKDVFDIQTNPYFLSQDNIDELNMEIEELKVI